MARSPTIVSFLLLLAWFSIFCNAQGYYPRFKATKEVTGIELGDVVVECYSDGVKVIIKKSRFPRIRSSDNLHFLDPFCRAGENETHYIASTTFRKCGVSRKMKWNSMAYSNTLMSGYPETDDFDPRCPVVSIKFTCEQSFFVWPRPRMTRAATKYINCEHIVALGPKIKQGVFASLKANSSGIRMRSRVKTCPMLIGIGPPIEGGQFARVKVKSKGFKIKRTQAFICRRIEGEGEYDLKLTAYTDEAFSNKIGKILYTPLLSVDVFYELRLKTSATSLTIYPKRCYATPTKDPLHKVQYTFIKDGCIKDDTVQLYTSDRQSFRFSIETFLFRGYRKAMMFVHCDVAICDVDDRESFCAKRCNNNNVRRKRGGSHRSGFLKECKFNRIIVSLRRSYLRRATQSNLQLEDPNCIASVNETHFSFNVHRGSCGTLAKTTGSRVEISNSINYRINGRHVFSIPVKCIYTKEKGIASAIQAFNVIHPDKFVSVWLGKKYHFNKKIVLDSSISNFLDDVPLIIKTNEMDDILDVTISPNHEGLDFVIDHCKVKPSPSSKRQRIIVNNDCSVDQSVFMHRTNTTARLFIDFKQWRTPGQRLFAKCHFTVCHRNAPFSKCKRKGCRKPAALESKSERRQKRSTYSSQLKVEVMCNPNKIIVAIEKKAVGRTRASDLHLRGKECRATENSTHIILETKPYNCQTNVKAFGKAVEYSNVILNDVKLPDGIISRVDTFELPFKCIFIPTESPKSPGFKAKKAVVKFSGISTGTYPVLLTLYTDPTFEVKMDSLSARMSPGSEMYLQVSMESPNATIAIYLEFCYGKPFFPSDGNDRYIFIRDNCPVDDTVLFYSSNRVDQKRFSVSPFEFSSAVYKSVFINCIVSACDPNDRNSRCFKTCPESPLPL